MQERRIPREDHPVSRKLISPAALKVLYGLRDFVGDVPWAHLDIAGVANRATADTLHALGPSGFGARLLDRLVARDFEAA